MTEEVDVEIMKNYSITVFVTTCLKPFKWHIFGMFCIASFWAINLSVSPYILKIMLDKIPTLTAQTAVYELSGPAILFLSLSLIRVSIFRIYDLLWIHFNPPLKRTIGKVLMSKMMEHSQTFL